MAEPSTQKKNKKGRKKSESSEVPSVSSQDKDIKNCISVNNNLVSEESARKGSENVKEPVVGDVKEASEDSANKKKKKSKKKSKESTKENVAVNSNSGSLLNYSENGIHLVNHPEISVTITDSSASEEKEIKSEPVKIPPVSEQKPKDVAVPIVTAPPTSNDTDTAKKKKKKKKKNSIDNSAAVPSPPNENTVATPTYTKVVTSDNTCVLVVNHESFSGNAKPVENSQSKISNVSDKNIKFSLPPDKQLGNVLITKNFTPDTNIQLNNSVSIFPVLTNGNSKDSEKQTDANIDTESNSLSEAAVDNSSAQESTEDSKPTKAQLKAERRAKQEAQRAAKLAKSNEKTDKSAKPVQENKNPQPKEKILSKENSPKTTEIPTVTSSAKLTVEKESLHKVKLFSHLPQCKPFDCKMKIHPAILEIGFQYNSGMICGSNARCVALLEAFAEVIKDYIPQPDKSFSRGLESNIQSYLSFLGTCRPLSVSMMNAVRFLKHEMNQIPSDMKIEEIKERLCDFIYNFVKVEIVLAKEEIANRASYKIINGDVIMVLAFSSVVRDILYKAHEKGKIFRVVVVDTRPKLEGLKMLRHLVKKGLQCTYISVNAVSYIMKEVTKVMIGAHALLANGCVMSRLGNKQVALIASTYGVPVFVCCETYKFCERVLTDSFVHNELGDPDDIITTSLTSNDSLKNWGDLPLLQPLNLLYDLTTPNLVSEIVTEKGTLPCTSVPVFLRVRFAGLS